MAGRFGQGDLLAGVVAAAALPLLIFVLDLAPLLAIPLAVATYAGVVLLAPPLGRGRGATRPDPEREGLPADPAATDPATAVPSAVFTGSPPPDRSAANGTIKLTGRQLEVLRLLADGRSNQEIADALFISPRTVPHHTKAIYDKLGVTSRTAAIAAARRHGLI